jgi:hypothetical protein
MTALLLLPAAFVAALAFSAWMKTENEKEKDKYGN